MSDLIPVNVVIADRTYRLKIDKADEEMVRKTVKLINDKILEFKSNFAGKDVQDYLAMVLLWFATEQSKPTMDVLEKDQLQEQISQLQQLITKALA